MMSSAGAVFSLLMIATGAILAWAVTYEAEGVNLSTVGVILMIVGILGLMLALLYFFGVLGAREGRVREQRVYEEPGHSHGTPQGHA